MENNCINKITSNEFTRLLKYKNRNDDKFFNCKTEYKKYLKSLDRRALEKEWLQNENMLSDLKYSYNYFKSYYFVNVYNYAKYINEDPQYIQLDEWVISVNANENLRTINNYLFSLCSYMKKYMKYIKKYKSKHKQRIPDWSNKLLFERTYNTAFECCKFYSQIEHLYNMLDFDYWKNMKHLNEEKVPTIMKKRFELLSLESIGADACDRISSFAKSGAIFETVEEYLQLL